MQHIPFQLHETVYTFKKRFEVGKKVFETSNDGPEFKGTRFANIEIKVLAHIDWEKETFALDCADPFNVEHNLIQLGAGIYVGNLFENMEAFQQFFKWITKIAETVDSIIKSSQSQPLRKFESDEGDEEDFKVTITKEQLERGSKTILDF